MAQFRAEQVINDLRERSGSGLTIAYLEQRREWPLGFPVVERSVGPDADVKVKAEAIYGTVHSLIRDVAVDPDSPDFINYCALAFALNIDFRREWSGGHLFLLEGADLAYRRRVANGVEEDLRVEPVPGLKYNLDKSNHNRRENRAWSSIWSKLSSASTDIPTAVVKWATERVKLSSPVTAHVNLPPTLQRDDFFGRQRELTEVIEHIHQHATVLIHGPGGIGKSQLAAQAIAAVEDDIGWIAKLDCSSPIADSQLAAFGRGIGVITDTNLSTSEQVGETKDYLGGAQTPWLLVLDNVPDLATFHRLAPTRKPNGSILVTSIPELAVSGSAMVGLKVLDRLHSVGLLAHLSGLPDDPQADELASELSDMPLALVQAGVYCRNRGVAFEEYLGRIRHLSLIDLSSAKSLYPNYDRTLYLTWRMSLLAAMEDADYTTTLLLYGPLAFLDGRAIPSSTALYGPPKLKPMREHALWALERYRLLDRVEDYITIHAVFQRMCREQLKFEVHSEDNTERMYIDCMELAFSLLSEEVIRGAVPTFGPDPGAWHQFRPVVPHLINWLNTAYILSCSELAKDAVVNFTKRAILYIIHSRMTARPGATCEPLLAAIGTICGFESEEFGTMLLYTAMSVRDDRYSGALDFARHGLSVIEASEADVEARASAKLMFAEVLISAKELDEAELVLRSLREAAESGGVDQAYVLRRLAEVAILAKKPEEGRRLLAKAVSVGSPDEEDIFGPETSAILALMFEGEHQTALQRASALHSRLVDLRGRSHAQTLNILLVIARLVEDHDDDYHAARAMRLEVVEGYIDHYGPSHPSAIHALRGLASNYEHTGDWQKALSLHEVVATSLAQDTVEDLGLIRARTQQAYCRYNIDPYRDEWREEARALLSDMQGHLDDSSDDLLWLRIVVAAWDCMVNRDDLVQYLAAYGDLYESAGGNTEASWAWRQSTQLWGEWLDIMAPKASDE